MRYDWILSNSGDFRKVRPRHTFSLADILLSSLANRDNHYHAHFDEACSVNCEIVIMRTNMANKDLTNTSRS